MKIKVLHIIKSLGRGGAETLLPETLALHNQADFEFHYIYFLPWKNQLVQSLEDQGVSVTCLNAKTNLRILASASKIVKYVKEHKINVIHCHLPWAGFVGRLVHMRIKIPVLYTEHNKQERYHRMTFALNKLTFNWQSTVIAVSGDVEDSIRKNIKPKVTVRTILNGVNIEKFKPTTSDLSLRNELGIPEDAIVVGTVAVFRFQKRLAEWLQVMKEVVTTDDRFYGLIVGDGPLKEELLTEQKRLDLGDRVIFAGLQKEVRPYLNDFDIYMMTSVFEGLPIALLEAMSMECAIVTTDAGGIKEVIENDKSGFMRSVDDYSLLREDVLKLKSEATRKEVGQAARMRVKNNFSLENMVKNLEKLYIHFANN